MPDDASSPLQHASDAVQGDTRVDLVPEPAPLSTLLSDQDPVLVLSPHFDDAILSAFGLLGGDSPIEVATVFTGEPESVHETGWDRLCGFSDSEDAVRGRRAENDRALSDLSVAQIHLGLLDAQYLDTPRTREDLEPVRVFVRSWVEAHGSRSIVAVPAGAGRRPSATGAGSRLVGGPRSERRAAVRRAVGPVGRAVLRGRARVVARRTRPFVHPDHVAVRDAAVEAMRGRPGGRVLLYEDLPYLWGSPADSEAADTGRSLGLGALEYRHEVDRDAKASRVAAYASQLRYMYAPHGELDTPSGLPVVERYWSIQ